MDNVTSRGELAEILRQEVSSYATKSYQGDERLYFAENIADQVYCVVAPSHPAFGKGDLVLMARIVNDQIIIDTDKTSKPLYEALRSAGISDEQLVIAWK